MFAQQLVLPSSWLSPFLITSFAAMNRQNWSVHNSENVHPATVITASLNRRQNPDPCTLAQAGTGRRALQAISCQELTPISGRIQRDGLLSGPSSHGADQLCRWAPQAKLHRGLVRPYVTTQHFQAGTLAPWITCLLTFIYY